MTCTLIFSLAISGGASKGAYEAALNWDFLKITKEYPDYMAQKGAYFYPTEMAGTTGLTGSL